MDKKVYFKNLEIGKYLGHGSSGVVCECLFNNNQYAYKEIVADDNYKIFVESRLKKLSQFYGDLDFVFPYKFIYDNSFDNQFCGYIMDYIKEYTELCELDIGYKEKIRILSKARMVLDKFHNEYKLIHTDINSWNFSYSKKSKKVILMDFDTCLDLNANENYDFDCLNLLAKTYLKYNPCDIGLDIFMFNILTFSILNDIEFYDSFDYLLNNHYGCIKDKNAIKILKKYDDIQTNTLKKEYVIDYL